MSSVIVENLGLDFMLHSGRVESSTEMHNETGGSVERDPKTGKHFIAALDDVSFEAHSGDRIGIIGRNGSGKSTLLRVLGSIYAPSRGSIRINGSVSPLFNVGLGMRPESTGRQNIVLRGLLKGLTRQEAIAKIPEIEQFTGLGAFLDVPIRNYSQGMAMRLAFATGTAFRPDILLLDEWIGAGDAEFRLKARDRMAKLVERAGIVLLASHNNGLIRNTCNRVIWLSKGKVKAYGNTEEVLDYYRESTSG